MLKKINLLIIVILFIVGASILAGYLLTKNSNPSIVGQCQIQEMTFYYLDSCGWCQKVKDEGTLDKIEKLGVKVTRINAKTGPIKHQFTGVPTFVVNNKVMSGYKTFEELKQLLGCEEKVSEIQELNVLENSNGLPEKYSGVKGEQVILKNGRTEIDVLGFEDNVARFYNVEIPSGKTVYFFVVKDKNGIYRAAANACQICFAVGTGFRQEGDEIVCNNCGNRYPIEKIATEKGGCNPGPINPDLKAVNGKIIIEQKDIEQVSDLF